MYQNEILFSKIDGQFLGGSGKSWTGAPLCLQDRLDITDTQTEQLYRLDGWKGVYNSGFCQTQLTACEEESFLSAADPEVRKAIRNYEFSTESDICLPCSLFTLL